MASLTWQNVLNLFDICKNLRKTFPSLFMFTNWLQEHYTITGKLPAILLETGDIFGCLGHRELEFYPASSEM